MKDAQTTFTNCLATITALAIILATGAARAEVLYDTSPMVTGLNYTHAINSLIGASSNTSLNSLRDSNVADDFTLTGDTVITSVSGWFHHNTANGIFTGQGVLVEMFADSDGHPVEVPSAAHFATMGERLTTAGFTTTTGTTGLAFTVDLDGLDITLGAGTWWISIVPVHDATPSTHYKWVAKSPWSIGLAPRGRSGGQDHGNNYSGHYCSTDWAALPCGAFPAADVAMKIEGVSATEACFADLAPKGGDGQVNVDDLLLLLGSWGPCKACSADLNSSGTVDVDDLLDLLAAWGVCP